MHNSKRGEEKENLDEKKESLVSAIDGSWIRVQDSMAQYLE